MRKKIAVLTAPKRFEIIEEELPPLGEKELLVRIISSGLCHSEAPAWLGESAQYIDQNDAAIVKTPPVYPLRPGHEAQGVVEEIGSKVTSFKVDDIVTGAVKPGFASYAVCPEEKLVKIPFGPKNPFDCIAEPLMCIVNIVRTACPEFGDTVAIIGCGCMGLLAVAALQKSSAKNLIALDLFDERLEQAKQWGATHIINPLKEDPEKAVFEIGNGADVVIELSGSLKGFGTALDIVKDSKLWDQHGRGKVLVSSVYGKEEKWPGKNGFHLMNKAPLIYAAHPRFAIDVRENYRRAISAYEDGTLPIDRIITHRFKLEEINEGFEMLMSGRPEYIKGIIDLS